MSPATPSFSVDELKSFALSLGFMACGVADLSPTPHGNVLDRWLTSGYGGVMRYLNRQAKKRKDPYTISEKVVNHSFAFHFLNGGKQGPKNGKGKRR